MRQSGGSSPHEQSLVDSRLQANATAPDESVTAALVRMLEEHASSLAEIHERLDDLADRLFGSTPPPPAAPSVPVAVPNGSLQAANDKLERIQGLASDLRIVADRLERLA